MIDFEILWIVLQSLDLVLNMFALSSDPL